MHRLPMGAIATLQPWFRPEQSGQLVGPHVINTGNGAMWADRWPQPRAILVECAGNYTLIGQPEAISAAKLSPLIVGFVDAAAPFAPLLHKAFPDLRIWDRVVYVLDRLRQRLHLCLILQAILMQVSQIFVRNQVLFHPHSVLHYASRHDH